MRPITDLVVDSSRPADVRVDLEAAAAPLEFGGQQLAGFTLNGTTPGPTITAVEGQLVEVHLVNTSVTEGVSLHWHGVDVPNAMDGVAGVTQDAVPVGGEFTYRFVAERAGSFWYHSHQVSDPQVRGGLFGGLVILPRSHAERSARRARHGPHVRGDPHRQRSWTVISGCRPSRATPYGSAW